MKFFTPVEDLSFDQKIKPGQKIITIGSCFSESMGERLCHLPLQVMNQPLGTLFHPNSILEVLKTKSLQENQCYEVEGQFVHPHFHSQWKSDSKATLIQSIEAQQQKVSNFLLEADWLIVTFGTAFYYYDQILDIEVANCHKQPQKRFIKKISTIDEITEKWKHFFDTMRVKNSALNILFTISPVRHTKDGIQNNQVSKSILRLAVEQLTHLFSNAYYFPAYEYVLDELRDYRFFKKDLIHPNDIAEEFIYEKMKRHLFEEALLEASIDSEKLEKRNNHRKLNAV